MQQRDIYTVYVCVEKERARQVLSYRVNRPVSTEALMMDVRCVCVCVFVICRELTPGKHSVLFAEGARENMRFV